MGNIRGLNWQRYVSHKGLDKAVNSIEATVFQILLSNVWTFEIVNISIVLTYPEVRTILFCPCYYSRQFSFEGEQSQNNYTVLVAFKQYNIL